MTAERRAVFLDRDGTLMEEVQYCADPAKVRAIPGAAGSLAALRREGWLNILITNQSGIGRGLLTVGDYEAVNRELFRQLGEVIDAAYFCPDAPDHPSVRRKPGIGMLEEAARDHGIAFRKSWVVGDKDIDVECGRRAGCRTVLVLTGYGERFRDCGADFLAPTIGEAVETIRRESLP